MQNTPASAPAQANPGFKLPSAASASADAASKPAEVTTAAPIEVAPVAGAPAVDSSTRDVAIGSVALLVLLVLFFFARNAYVHHLVVRRVAPSAAGSAGWLMFVGLSFISAAAVLAIVNSTKYLSFWITAPLIFVGAVTLIATLFVGRR